MNQFMSIWQQISQHNQTFCKSFYSFYIWTSIKPWRKKTKQNLCLFAPLTFLSITSSVRSDLVSGRALSLASQQTGCLVTRGHQPDFLLSATTTATGDLHGATGSIVWRESDVRLRLRPLVRESRVALACVAWNGGTPFVHWGQALRDAGRWEVLSLRRLRGRMVGAFLCSCSPRRSVLLMSFLCLVSPVCWGTENRWWMRQSPIDIFQKQYPSCCFTDAFGRTWSWWFQTSSPCSRSWCSSCTAISCRMQRLPVGNKITSAEALHICVITKINSQNLSKFKRASYSQHPSEQDQSQWQLLWGRCWICQPAKQQQLIEASLQHIYWEKKLLLLLLYLAVDHDIKANSIHFKQRPERLTVLVLEIPGVSVGIGGEWRSLLGHLVHWGQRRARDSTWSCILTWPSCSYSCPDGWRCTQGYTGKSPYRDHSSIQSKSPLSRPKENEHEHLRRKSHSDFVQQLWLLLQNRHNYRIRCWSHML